jgi:pantetheine-phosphate adenylyltransferase
MRIGVYPGSFDPITNGHLDIIERACRLVDKLYVAVAINPNKKPLFEVEERIAMIQQAVKHLPNVKVDYFRGLLVEYARKKKANVILKGLRAVSDFEYEFQMALVNRELDPSVETIFLMTNYRYAFLSSSLMKEVVSLGGTVKGMVPPFVEKRLKEKLLAKRRKNVGDVVVKGRVP